MSQTIQCPECGSSDVQFSDEQELFVCEKCGHTFQSDQPFTRRRIFISYGHDEHVELAQRLRKDLECRGHAVWFDLDRLKPGGDWEAYIEEGIDWVSEVPDAGRVVLLMTPHSVRRPDGYCLNELARALGRELNPIPVMVVWCEPPLSICRIQWLDMQDCVPLDDRAERYDTKFQRLLEALERDRLDFEGGQARLLSLLDPLPFDADIARHLERFTGRQWVFDKIDEWLSAPEASRVFWLTGKPGVGKTAIAAWLCYHRREVAAFHLCQHGHDQKSDPRQCVLSLAYQLSSQLPDYQDRLNALPLEILTAEANARTLFDTLIVQPLSGDFPQPNRTILILIDALDEATETGRNELASFIASEFDKTPRWLRLVITSRDEPEVTHPLQALTPYVLDTSAAENEQDIVQFLHRELKPYAEDEGILRSAIDTILELSEGVFLYVESVCREVAHGRLSLFRLDEFPQGLGGIYAQYFSRQFADIERYTQRTRPVLDVVAAAQEPLELKMIASMFGWGEHDLREFCGSLGSLFTIAEGRIQAYHASVMEWLTDAEKAGRYFVSRLEGHHCLADRAWLAYQTDFQSGPSQLSEYSRAYLATHLAEAGRWQELLVAVTSPTLKLVEGWVERADARQGVRCLAGLIEHVDLDPVLAAILATQAGRIHSQRGEYTEAKRCLEYAIARTSPSRGRRTLAIALHELASLHLYREETREATSAYRRALRLCISGKPAYLDEAAANRIALATIAFGNYQWSQTIRFARRASREARGAGDMPHLIAAERWMGAAFEQLGRYAEAEAKLEEALASSRQHGVASEEVRLVLAIGWLRYDQAHRAAEVPSLAEAHFVQAADLAETVHSFYSLLDAELGLAWCALVRGNAQQALEWFETVIAALPNLTHADLLAGALVGRAATSHWVGHFEEADRQYREASTYAEAHSLRNWVARALVGRGAICWHTDTKNLARTLWGQARLHAKRASPRLQQLISISIDLCKQGRTLPPR